MRKAKEYVDELVAASKGGVETFTATLKKVNDEFFAETAELARVRSVRSNTGMFGILDEQDRKWRSMIGPQMHSVWMAYRTSLQRAL